MKLPKFSRWITIPVLFFLNLLAWLYIYDDYMMGWLIVYPLFMAVALAFTIAGELAFGKDRKFKYIGINICIVLLLLIIAQKYLPMDKLEANLLKNYYGHIKADTTLNPSDKGVRKDGYTIVARDYGEDDQSAQDMDIVLEVYKNGQCLDSIKVAKAVEKVQQFIPTTKQGEFTNLFFNETRYIGMKRKGGEIGLVFNKGYVDFIYKLTADSSGFIWDEKRYQVGSMTFPRMEGLYDDSTNRKIKDIFLKGDKEQLVDIELVIKGDKTAAIESLQNLGYEIISQEPLTVKIPFYEIANLGHQSFVDFFEIK